MRNSALPGLVKRECGCVGNCNCKSSPMTKRGLWDNIHAKRKRGEAPNKPGDKGYPTDKALRDSQ